MRLLYLLLFAVSATLCLCVNAEVKTEFYKNGQKKTEINLVDGMRQGVATWWHENGQKEFEVNYVDGMWQEVATWWHENGQKKAEINYKDGKEHGLRTDWYENGQKEFEVNYVDGMRQEVATWWHENGQKKAEINYKDGKEHGLRTQWNENGEIVNRSQWSEGVVINPQGKWSVTTDVSPLDDSTNVYACVLSGDTPFSDYTDIPPMLHVRIKEGELEAYISINHKVSPNRRGLYDRMPVTIRMDKRKAVTRNWSMSTSREAFFHPLPKTLVNVLRETNNVLIIFTPYQSNPVQITFDTRGFDEVYKKF